MITEKNNKLIEDPKGFLTWLQIGALLATLIWVFAFMRSDVNSNTQNIERHENQIQRQISKQAENDVKHAITNEQYRQIIQQLRQINEKLDN